MTKFIINTDGGSRGNPGPAAIGVVIGPSTSSGQAHEYGEYIGKTTNNVAEYKAVVFALKKAKAILGGDRAAETDIEVRADSELLVRQMNGEYKIKNVELQPLFFEIWNAKIDFKSVVFKHVPREENRDADRLVNKALDTLI
ncbi:ribonuclease HI family protein [Patescibacteria group bacterium]|nr:ribonuclease HI family protein [Patescibacteria group bacterium]